MIKKLLLHQREISYRRIRHHDVVVITEAGLLAKETRRLEHRRECCHDESRSRETRTERVLNYTTRISAWYHREMRHVSTVTLLAVFEALECNNARI